MRNFLENELGLFLGVELLGASEEYALLTP